MSDDDYVVIFEPDVDFYHVATLITAPGRRKFSVNRNNIRKLDDKELILLLKASQELIKNIEEAEEWYKQRFKTR